MTPSIGVLALQGDVREHVAALHAAGAQTRPVRRPEDLPGIDGILLPGGESTTMDHLLRAFELDEPLRGLIKDGLPAFGSCAGMVLLADRVEGLADGQRTLGGMDVTVRRNAFGRQVDSFEAPVDVADVPGGPVHGVFIRAPWVSDVGPGVSVLARLPGGSVHVLAGLASGVPGASPSGVDRIVAVRQGRLLATSFHPELSGDARVHELFIKIVKG